MTSHREARGLCTSLPPRGSSGAAEFECDPACYTFHLSIPTCGVDQMRTYLSCRDSPAKAGGDGNSENGRQRGHPDTYVVCQQSPLSKNPLTQ